MALKKISGQNKFEKEIAERQQEEDIKKGNIFVNEFLEDFLKEAIITNTRTISRLLKEEHGSDALTLYAFYCYCSSRQRTTSVYATDYFCRKGLHWGETRFRRAKKLLIDLNVITPKVLKDKKGQILKHFIRIHYLKAKKPRK